MEHNEFEYDEEEIERIAQINTVKENKINEIITRFFRITIANDFKLSEDDSKVDAELDVFKTSDEYK